ncbi:MAG: hypothetical protein KF724_01795 [Phycisphaeraceae bacterium]|nr:hypothetical protein [Phycisphaeraceae bacterium]
MAKFTWSVNGRSPSTAPVSGILLPNGQVQYKGIFKTSEGVTLNFDYKVDSKNDPIALMSGWIKCSNSSSTAQGIDASFSVPLCPDIPGGTTIGGSVTLLATANQNGATISCLPGAVSLWQVLIDETTTHQEYWCPFILSTTGSGTIQTNKIFGAPIPSLPGPNSAPSVGSRNRFTISDGDSFQITSNIIVKSLGLPSACVADLNGDGTVNALDLAELLGLWGDHTNPCLQGDFDGNLTVDAKDVALLLGAWGPCDP